MIYCCPPPGTLISVNVKFGVVSQLSVAVAVPVLLGLVDAVHSIVRLGGQVMRGGALSSTTMV